MILPCLLFMYLLHAWLQLSIAGTNDDNNSIYLSVMCVCMCVFDSSHSMHKCTHTCSYSCIWKLFGIFEYHPTIIPTFDQWLEILPIEFKFTITIPSKGGLFFFCCLSYIISGIIHEREIYFKVKTNRYSKVQQ